MRRVCASILLALALLACESALPDVQNDTLPVEALQDPETCRPCHAQHYEEWASSMHAYAAKDPVFIAMNERGQRETGGALGEFCVRCHAPMAVELGLTRDGLNLPDIRDPNARGVTCYFCHNVDTVVSDHNRGLSLAHDDVMRAGLRAPAKNAAHASAYSSLHDATIKDSAALCGACHDVMNQSEVALERTFKEWQTSHFSRDESLSTCSSCHMPSYRGRATPAGPQRTLHRHLWPGVDTALTTDWPGMAAQAAAIDCAFEGALELRLSAPSRDRVDVVLRNRGVGHAWPSGAAQDRRAWIELVAYDADDHPVYQSGVIEDGAVVGANEPSLDILRDELHDATGKHVHMFWEAAASDEYPNGYASHLLDVPGSSGSVRHYQYSLPELATRVTARLRMQALGLDVIDDFLGLPLPITERVLADVYMKHSLRSRIRTMTVPGTQRELSWRDGQVVERETEDALEGCAEHAYVSKL